MIIGVSGKIGSGKDTVGQIIQYLSLPKHEMADFQTFLVEYNNDEWDTNWEIRKWADKLKDMVCMLIGCTREKLEDRDFKEAPLGEEWDRWGFTTHYLRDQLDKIGDNGLYLSEEEAIKAERNMRIGMNWSKSLVSKLEKVQMTPRLMLQLLGTDCGRDTIHPNIWVNSLMADYKSTVILDGYSQQENFPNWIVTDTRFPNEANSILDNRGVLIRVNRGDGNTGNHPSETALDSYKKWNYIINNNGTIEELLKKVRKILIKENLI